MAIDVADFGSIVNYIHQNFGIIGKMGTSIVWYFFGMPLRILYFHGLWEGRAGEDICGQITSVDSSFWAFDGDRKMACIHLLDRKFNSFAVSAMIIVYFLCLFRLFMCMFSYRCKKKCIHVNKTPWLQKLPP